MNLHHNTSTAFPSASTRPKHFRVLTGQISALATLMALPALSFAQSPDERLNKPAVEAVGPTELPEVVVRAGVENTVRAQVNAELEEARETYPGSVSTVTPEEMEIQKPGNLGEVIARIPGATYIDEDGRGTRPNIGLRGLNPLRSEYVQLLLDGVPIQPSLYSEQSAYYGVPAERIIGIEVFKGGSSVLFGPNTVGGVFNFISRPLSTLPFEAVLDTRVSSYGDYAGNIFLSGTHGPASWGIEYLHKEGDGFRDSSGYSIDDIDIKLGIRFNDSNWAQLRFQYYDEESETPGGLLPKQFRNDVHQSNKPNDEFYGKRIGGDLRTFHQLSERQVLETLFYAYSFERNWFLQNYRDNASTDLTLADTNAQYLRDFSVVGFEPKYSLNYDLGGSTGHELTIGGRIYYDQVNRQTAVGNHGDSREGANTITESKELTTLALAVYVQNEFRITERLSIVPGLRFEHIEQTQEDVFNGTPEQSMDYDVWVPGLGVKYEVAPKTLLYANVTRSFRPPTFGNSFDPTITISGAELKPSTAWTYEAGIRANPAPWLLADFGGFYTDFQDQVVTANGLATNADTRTYGLEGFVQVGLFGLTHAIQTRDWNYTGDHEVFLVGGVTLVDSEFKGGPYGGNDLPYVPDQTVTFGVRYSFRDRFDVLFQGRYVGDRFTDFANTVEENAIGTVGVLDAYTVFDLKSRWKVSENFVVTAGINNLFDEKYGTQRRTDQQKGIFPGPTREFYVGATIRF